jgi:cytochrome oxidase Cu insertion factor (SCO1/SenC/PrrC family)
VAVAVDPRRDTPESARAFLSKQRMTGRMDLRLLAAGA